MKSSWRTSRSLYGWHQLDAAPSTIARKVLENDHYPLVIQFLDEYQMTKFDECDQLYFFFGLLDQVG